MAVSVGYGWYLLAGPAVGGMAELVGLRAALGISPRRVGGLRPLLEARRRPTETVSYLTARDAKCLAESPPERVHTGTTVRKVLVYQLSASNVLAHEAGLGPHPMLERFRNRVVAVLPFPLTSPSKFILVSVAIRCTTCRS